MCWAIDHAHEGDTITLVTVWESSRAMVNAGLCDPDDDSAAIDFAHGELARAQALLECPDVVLGTDVVRGDPRRGLCELDTDLLVVGSHGGSGVAGRLLGSVSHHLAQHAPFPIVIVPAHRR